MATTVYTYSAMTYNDVIKCVCANDNWNDAVDKAAESEEKVAQLAQLMSDEDTLLYFLQTHRIIFMDDNGDGDALGVNVPEIDEPDMYRLYTGFIGNDLVLSDESEDCDSLVEKFNFAVHKAHSVMAMLDKDEADRCASEYRGIIIKTNDRNFIRIL